MNNSQSERTYIVHVQQNTKMYHTYRLQRVLQLNFRSFFNVYIFFNLKRFAPDIGTNVNFLGSVYLISTLKKKNWKIIKEICGYWACFAVTRF
jgi:cell division protein FtsW (lipid II flippase)